MTGNLEGQSMVQVTRLEALRDLVELRTSLADAVAGLSRFSWDCDNESFRFERRHALSVLMRYGKGELSALDCQRWAEALEVRDDLGLEPGYEELLKTFLFQLATPELEGPLTSETVREWEVILTGSSKSK